MAAVDGIDQDAADRFSRLPAGTTYEQWKAGKAESARSMASANGIEWPGHGRMIRRAEYLSLRDEASKYGIKLVNFAKSDVDPAAAKLAINAVAKALDRDKRIASAFPEGLTLELSGMYSGDFASMSREDRTRLRLNYEAMRDVRVLKEQYSNLVGKGWFVAGTEADAVLFHEIGHSVAYASGIDPLEISREITGKSGAELLEYVRKNLSEYAAAFADGTEIASEAFSAYISGVDNEFAEKFAHEVLRRME